MQTGAGWNSQGHIFCFVHVINIPCLRSFSLQLSCTSYFQGDTPVEKRPKLGGTGIEAKGKAKMAKNIDFAEVGVNEEPKLPLSANEKVFSIGSTKEENKLNMVRTMRSGLEKEGSRVVFGVPKPGKKRKFMEVSKHYVSDRISKTNVPNDSVKLSKYLMPQVSGSRGFRNSSKLDSKQKQVADSKPRAGKPPSIPSRTLARRDDSTSSRSNARDAASSDNVAKGSTSNDEDESSEQNLAEVDEASRGAMLFSSQALPQGSRKKAVRHTKSERLHQGKLAPAGRKSAKDEEPEKLTSEVGEPRRSNRRIQPTSRVTSSFASTNVILYVISPVYFTFICHILHDVNDGPKHGYNFSLLRTSYRCVCFRSIWSACAWRYLCI